MTLRAVPMSIHPAALGAAETEFARLIAASLRVTWSDGRVVEVPAGYTTGWRRMPLALAAQVIAGTSTIEREDEHPRQLCPGQAICLPSGVLHRITHHDDGVSAYAHIDFRVFASVDVLALVAVPMIISGAPAQVIGRLCASLSELPEHSAGLIGRVCARQALSFSLLDVLVGQGVMIPRALEALRAAQRLTPALETIERDLSQLDVASLGHRVGVSRSRLHTLFVLAFSCSPIRYVRHRRIERARELLATSDLSIADVCELVGFGDQFHFSRAFKSEHGVSPTQYRERLGAAIF